MKLKTKIAFLLAVLILAGAFAMMVFTANAATDTTADTAASSAVTSSATTTTTTTDKTMRQKSRPQLTDAQKTEMKAKMEELKAERDAQNAKWNALTDAQKAEVYALQDQKATLEKQQVDKYLELGVIDSDTAAQMKKDIDAKYAQIKADGKIPMMGGMGCHKGGRGCPPPPATDDTK